MIKMFNANNFRMCRVYIVGFLFISVVSKLCAGNVMISLNIQSYSNPNGTSYVATTINRKCCDGPPRSDCTVGDTCDTYFDICIGSMDSKWGCKGAFFKTIPAINENSITNVSIMEEESTTWSRGMMIFVFVRDDDSNGTIQSHDHIDTLIDKVNFFPADNKDDVVPQRFQWQGKTSLSLSVSAWCPNNFYGQICDVHCVGLKPMALCEGYTGKLTCQPSGELIIEFRRPVDTSSSALPDLIFALNKFVQDRACIKRNNHTSHTPVYYPSLDYPSNTMTFTADCGDHQLTAIEFESILQMQSQSTLNSYFSPGVITGPIISPKGYGEHIKPNVFIGIELLELNNPDGTSYDGDDFLGERRCCDIPSKTGCITAKDNCDMQVTICIGEINKGVCIGSVSIFPAYADTISIETCGPALLDNTNNVAHVAHPMTGGMRLAQNSTQVRVIIKDVDQGGNSSDIIDMLATNITVIPGPNVTYAKSMDVTIKNIATLTLRLLFWCADDHSGPLCHSNNGTDRCQPGWYGDECEISYNACSPNPCKHGGTCNLTNDISSPYKCQCPSGYTGASCEHDVDECSLHVCQHNATCQNSDGSFNCLCTPLWDGLICTDSRLPACDPNPCSNGKCIAVNGLADPTSIHDYRCLCNKGYIGENCNQRSSCTTCQHGDCRSINGIDTCVCHFGYGGSECNQDINECDASPCKNGATCHNTFGNFSCQCPVGYSGQICGQATGACRGDICLNNGTCLDIGGGNYLCMCQKEYTGDTCQTLVDHCANIICDNNGTCRSNFEDFLCDCSSGWSGKTCDVDINECLRSVCVNSASCTNSAGSYTCNCLNGWSGQNCDADVDECKQSVIVGFGALCDNGGNCQNTQGSFKCMCTSGFTGFYCDTKLDFCANNSVCHGNGKCLELPTGHCQCNSGFTGAGCGTDINECVASVCGPNGYNCTNSPGAYNCTCSVGWAGANCTDDVNECDSSKNIPCSGNGMCANSPGNYKCTCFQGFTGRDCEQFVDTCKSTVCKNNGTCVLKNAETRCSCTSTWTGIACESDVNECEDDMACNLVGVCENTDGSYYCRCYGGWTGSTCQTDVNECTGPICQNNGVCTNSPGTYKCACQTGWNGMTCEVKLGTANTGTRLQFYFNQNITNDITQTLVTFTHQFLTTYICNSTDLIYSKETFRDNMFEVYTSCSQMSITQSKLTSTLAGMSNTTLSHLFPLPLQSLQVVAAQPTTTLAPDNTNSWISTYWPVFVGAAAAIIIVLAVIGGCIRDKRRSKTEDGGFSNPSYRSDYTKEMHHYDDMNLN